MWQVWNGSSGWYWAQRYYGRSTEPRKFATEAAAREWASSSGTR